MQNRIGQQFGNYRLVRLLGGGGFADVYLGEHLYLRTQAAIKIMHGQIDEHDKEEFLEEARVIASLKHPRILRVLEFGFEQRTPFLVMDYASNGTLRNRHPRGTPVALDSIIFYVKEIAEGLQYAHQRELIHRDIKPENLLLDEDKHTLLGDFGIALKGSQHADMAGTAFYMAPEQILGQPRRLSDQYSLGVVVYEWLTGQPPFTGRTFREVVVQHLQAPVPALKDIDARIEKIVLKALAKDPDQRFPSVQDFAVTLEQAGSALTISVPDDKYKRFLMQLERRFAQSPYWQQLTAKDREQLLNSITKNRYDEKLSPWYLRIFREMSLQERGRFLELFRLVPDGDRYAYAYHYTTFLWRSDSDSQIVRNFSHAVKEWFGKCAQWKKWPQKDRDALLIFCKNLPQQVKEELFFALRLSNLEDKGKLLDNIRSLSDEKRLVYLNRWLSAFYRQ